MKEDLINKFTEIADKVAQHELWDDFNDVLYNSEYGSTRKNLLEEAIEEYTKYVWNSALNWAYENAIVQELYEIPSYKEICVVDKSSIEKGKL